MDKPKIILADVDGILCGNKHYNSHGNCIGKMFIDHDFTAIKEFKALGIPFVFVTSDAFNEGIANKRNIPFYYTRSKNGKINKGNILSIINKHYGINKEHVVYIADDRIDEPLLKKVGWAFCPIDSPKPVKDICIVLNKRGGDALIRTMFDWFVENKILQYPLLKHLLNIDAFEYNRHGKMCVYRIFNKINDKSYIGQTNNSKKRWYEHRLAAKNDSKSSPKLYNAMRKYGIENFEFVILEMGDSESWALRIETKYIEYFSSVNNGYNCIEDTIGGFRLIPHDVKGNKNPMFGKSHSLKTINKIKATKANSQSSIGENNPRAKWHYTLFDPNGKCYETNCLSTFCPDFELDRRTMVDVMSGKIKQHKGWTGHRILRKDMK